MNIFGGGSCFKPNFKLAYVVADPTPCFNRNHVVEQALFDQKKLMKLNKVTAEHAQTLKKRQQQKQVEEQATNSLCYLRAVNDYLRDTESKKDISQFKKKATKRD